MASSCPFCGSDDVSPGRTYCSPGCASEHRTQERVKALVGGD